MEKLQKMLNNFNLKFKISKQLIISSAVFALVFFVAFSTIFKIYRADVTILLTAKSQTAAIQADRITSNLIVLGGSVSFYDRLVKLNPGIGTRFNEQTVGQKKEFLGELVQIKKVGKNSTILKISTLGQTSSEAGLLAQKIARTLFDTASFYYNVKDDIDLRIVDSSISKTAELGFPFRLLISILAGAITAGLVEGIVALTQKNIFTRADKFRENIFKNLKNPFEKKISPTGKENPEEKASAYERLYLADEEMAEAPYVWEDKIQIDTMQGVQLPPWELNSQNEPRQEMKRLTKMMEPGKYPNFPEMPIQAKAAAPANLPIAEDSFFAAMPEAPANLPVGDSIEASKKETEPETLDTNREPTQEELKKRLNQLLRGEL